MSCGKSPSVTTPTIRAKFAKNQFPKRHLADGQMSDEVEPSEVSSWEPSLLLCALGLAQLEIMGRKKGDLKSSHLISRSQSEHGA